MNKVYINNKSIKQFDTLRNWLISQFKFNARDTRLVRNNLESNNDYFVINNIVFENKNALRVLR